MEMPDVPVPRSDTPQQSQPSVELTTPDMQVPPLAETDCPTGTRCHGQSRPECSKFSRRH